MNATATYTKNLTDPFRAQSSHLNKPWPSVAVAGRQSYREEVPQGFGRMVGNPAFEIARGVLVEVYRYTPYEAMIAIGAVARRTVMSAAAVVDRAGWSRRRCR